MKIDWDDLEGAFEFNTYESRHYLDTETAETILLADGVDDVDSQGWLTPPKRPDLAGFWQLSKGLLKSSPVLTESRK